jgi:hypothetical protein
MLFFSDELRAVRRLVRRTSLIEDLISGICGFPPGKVWFNGVKRGHIVIEAGGPVKNG